MIRKLNHFVLKNFLNISVGVENTIVKEVGL
jgi:hypothetical protein